MTRAEIRRPDVEAALVEAGRRAGPTLLAGPPGAGKTRLLWRTAAALEAEGSVTVYLDLLGAASSPDGLVRATLRALPAVRFGAALAPATEVAGLGARDRHRGAQAVRALLRLLASLTHVEGRSVVLLLDEATELPRSLAYFEGLRHVARDFAEALAGRRAPTLLATSLPSQARQLWPAWPLLQARPLTVDELRPDAEALGVEAESLLALSFGWPRYVDRVLQAVTPEGGVAEAWCREMAPDGRLELACRHTWETLLLRSRGYGMAKAVLEAVAEREGQNLTSLVTRLGRTPGAVRDYLGWLLAVDGLHMVKKRYYFVDGLLRSFLRLHGRGTLPSEAQIHAEAERLLSEAAARRAGKAAPADAESPAAAMASAEGEPASAPDAAGAEAEPVPAAPAAPARRDSLIEID